MALIPVEDKYAHYLSGFFSWRGWAYLAGQGVLGWCKIPPADSRGMDSPCLSPLLGECPPRSSWGLEMSRVFFRPGGLSRLPWYFRKADPGRSGEALGMIFPVVHWPSGANAAGSRHKGACPTADSVRPQLPGESWLAFRPIHYTHVNVSYGSAPTPT